MPVELTQAYHKINALTKFFRIIRGSMSSSKTYSIATKMNEIAWLESNTTITIITSTYQLLKDGVIADMKNIFVATGFPFSDWYNKTDKDISYPNGSIVQFRNLDALDEDKGKGSRRHYLFLNEADRLNYAAIDPYIVRTDVAVYMDFNHSRHFFVDDIFLDAQRDDVDFLTLTYKHNHMIPKGELKTIEDRIAASLLPGAPDSLKQWVLVFAKGQKGALSERMIYQFDVAEIPATAKKAGSGMDFGKYPDRTVLVDIYIDGANLYVDEVFCLNNLEAEKVPGAERMSIVDHMDFIKYPKGQLIIADSSGRTSILDLRKHQYNVAAVKKDKGRLIDSINRVRSFKIHITPGSINTKKDLEGFFWKVNRDGVIIPEIDGHEPDTAASIRYGLMSYKTPIR